MTPLQMREVSRLFEALFGLDNEELVGRLKGHPHITMRFLAGLPPAGSSNPATFQWKMIERLSSYGIFDEQLFEQLAQDQPQDRKRKIDAVAALFGIGRAGPWKLLMTNADVGDRLRLAQEQAIAVEATERGRDNIIDIIHRAHVDYGSMIQAVIEKKPDMLHFAGHGRRDGSIAFADAHVSPGKLAEAFASLRQAGVELRTVVFNCCFSSDAAEAISYSVERAIGFDGELDGSVALAFTRSFYGILTRIKDVDSAFRLARNAASTKGSSAALARLFNHGRLLAD